MGLPSKMTVVKSVETFMCVGNVAQIAHFDRNNLATYSKVPLNQPSDAVVTKETVHGRYFTNGDGDTCLIGLSKQATEVLGLPFEAIERLEQDIRDQNATINKYSVYCCKQDDVRENLNSQVAELTHDIIATRGLYENAGLWTRIKFLFTGEL